MYKIQNITTDPKQAFSLTVPNSGDVAQLALRYSSNSQGWVMDLTYGNTVITNRRVCSSPSLLRQWKNIFPFGLACFAVDGTDPYYISDFQSGRCCLMVTSAEETGNYEKFLSVQKDAEA